MGLWKTSKDNTGNNAKHKPTTKLDKEGKSIPYSSSDFHPDAAKVVDAISSLQDLALAYQLNSGLKLSVSYSQIAQSENSISLNLSLGIDDNKWFDGTVEVADAFKLDHVRFGFVFVGCVDFLIYELGPVSYTHLTLPTILLV